jgi:hypothetical protein
LKRFILRCHLGDSRGYNPTVRNGEPEAKSHVRGA